MISFVLFIFIVDFNHLTLQMIIPIILIKVSPGVCLWIGMNRWPCITRKVLLTLCVMIQSSVFVRVTMNRGGRDCDDVGAEQ